MQKFEGFAKLRLRDALYISVPQIVFLYVLSIVIQTYFSEHFFNFYF